jgi:hypothetical protein
MRPRALLVLALGLTLASCGGGDDDTKPGPKPAPKPPPVTKKAESPRVKVIRAWTDSLRKGQIRKATSYFGVPAIVSNSGPAITLRTRAEVRFFNLSLPCGARLRKTVTGKRYTIAVFVLTDRVGSRCDGPGNLAATAFAFRKGKIIEWRRVQPPESGPTV